MVRLATYGAKLDLACLIPLMIMLVGLIDGFTSKINCLLCALQTLKRTFTGIPFKMLKIWSLNVVKKM
jgi:hypothetical protein